MFSYTTEHFVDLKYNAGEVTGIPPWSNDPLFLSKEIWYTQFITVKTSSGLTLLEVEAQNVKAGKMATGKVFRKRFSSLQLNICILCVGVDL
jgi:hypothetical protein